MKKKEDSSPPPKSSSLLPDLSRLSFGRPSLSAGGGGAAPLPPQPPSVKFSGVASTTMSKLEEGDSPEGKVHHWMPCLASTFVTRIGPAYARNKQKAPSPDALMELCGVDLVRTPSRIDNLGARVTFPDDFFSVPSPLPGVPSLFIVNCQVPQEFPTSIFTDITDGPGWSIAYYFRLTSTTRDFLSDLANAPAAVKLFAAYCMEAPELDHDPKSKWKGKFKAMYRCENMEQFGLPSFITSYNAKPVLINKTGSLVRGERYIEMDINLHRFSSMAKKGLQILIPYFSEMTVSCGFTIESEADDEMPETLFGCASTIKGSHKNAQDV